MHNLCIRTSADSGYHGLGNISVAKYRFRLVVTRDIVLPRYKGSALHGGFGHALKAIAPAWYPYFFEPRPSQDAQSSGKSALHERSLPKPFVLLPPLDDATVYRRGENLACELTLFGEAAQHVSICHAAFDYLGTRLGFGCNRGNFRVEDVAGACPGQCKESSRARQLNALWTGDEIAEACTGLGGSAITLQFPTRLRLKVDNRLARNALAFPLFFQRLVGRLNTLAVFYGGGEVLGRRERSELLRQADNVAIDNTDLDWQEWERFSGRQEEWMKFGGLVGSVSYEGDTQAFLPYLAVGEWTHVGGKTSFGLGKYWIQRGG